MNFDFSDELKALGGEAARFLAGQNPLGRAREALSSGSGHDAELWRRLGELGWLGMSIPEAYGGSGLGFQGLCLIAEEMGRCLAPVPFSSSLYLAAETLLMAGTQEQKERLLPGLAAGSLTGTVAFSERTGDPSPAAIEARVHDGRLSGEKLAVPDGGIADFAIVVAKAGDDDIGLFLVDLAQQGVTVSRLETLDPSRGQARITFDGAVADRMMGEGWDLVLQVLARAAILVAFEQIGGAYACLYMARDYALERPAFGRPIGSFQAIKHKLAQVFASMELARSNAFYAAWAGSGQSGDEVLKAAALARITASKAFELAARENIQTHAGIGFTWESDCQLFYRRAKALSLQLGSPGFWSRRLMEGILRARVENVHGL